MYFTTYTPIFRYEVMIRMIPNFLPRGHGMYVFIHSETKEETDCDLCCYYKRTKCDLTTCPFIKQKIKFGTATKKQIMDAFFMNIRHSKFRERLSLFIRESENTNMNYFNKWHEHGFNKALERIDRENYKLILKEKMIPFMWLCLNLMLPPLVSIGERFSSCRRDLLTETKIRTL